MKRHCLVFPKVMFSNSSQSGDELPLGRDVIYSRNVRLWTIWSSKSCESHMGRNMQASMCKAYLDDLYSAHQGTNSRSQHLPTSKSGAFHGRVIEAVHEGSAWLGSGYAYRCIPIAFMLLLLQLVVRSMPPAMDDLLLISFPMPPAMDDLFLISFPV
jgi:hypothetical protein